MLVFGIIVFLIYSSTSFYIGYRLFQTFGLLFPEVIALILILIYALILLSSIIVFIPRLPGIKNILRAITQYWIGFYIYLFLLFIAADLLILLGSLVNLIPDYMLAGIRMYSGLTVIALTICLNIYGLYNARHIITTTYDVKLKHPLPMMMKVVMISDLHIGQETSESRIERVVQGINDLEPDIVCLVGDIFNNDYTAIKDIDKVIALLKSIKAAFGVYACLGNHDAGKTLDQLINILIQSNIRLLNDEYAVINESLVLLGRLDANPIGDFGNLKRKDTIELLAFIDTDKPIVVLDHNPKNIKQYGNKVDLILSGHTHKGQIFPFNLITKILFTVDHGHYQENHDNPHVIVGQGTGTWIPIRIATKNEIVFILLS